MKVSFSHGYDRRKNRLLPHHQGSQGWRREACIDGTRITVKDIVSLHEESRAPEQMLDAFGTSLTLGQVDAALAYYYDKEIDASFADEDKVVAEHDRKRERST